jgi:predicted Zn-dependent peptidase
VTKRPDEHGISHLLERRAFKGTSRRTARQIAKKSRPSGDLNVATSVEMTAYYARTLSRRAAALDVLRHPSDPAFDPEELQRNKG